MKQAQVYSVILIAFYQTGKISLLSTSPRVLPQPHSELLAIPGAPLGLAAGQGVSDGEKDTEAPTPM